MLTSSGCYVTITVTVTVNKYDPSVDIDLQVGNG